MFGYFYNEQFRRYIVAFGSLFDSIYVARHAGGEEVQRILVPIEFGPKERWLTRLTQDPDFTQGVGQIVPRFAYEYGAPSYDASRHLNTLNQLRFPSDVPGATTRVWAGVTQARIEQVQVDLFASTTFDLSEPPLYVATEEKDLLDNEDLTLLADETTSNAYLTTDAVERITVTADPLDQPDDGDIAANTVIERLS
jgi:hypothetical protein